MYRLTIRKQAIKAMLKMPGRDARYVRGELEKLARDPNRSDIDVARLRGRSGFRVRAGNWRVIFKEDEEIREISVLRIGPRDDVYKA